MDYLTNTALPAIKAGYAPAAIAITPDGTTAYVATFILEPREYPAVIPIDTATNTVSKGIGTDPDDIAITPCCRPICLGTDR